MSALIDAIDATGSQTEQLVCLLEGVRASFAKVDGIDERGPLGEAYILLQMGVEHARAVNASIANIPTCEGEAESADALLYGAAAPGAKDATEDAKDKSAKHPSAAELV